MLPSFAIAQLLPDGVPARIRHGPGKEPVMRPQIKITPSRVRDFLACPLKYSRLYGPAQEYQQMAPRAPLVAQPESTTNAMSSTMSMSNSIHSALDALHRPCPTELLGLNEPYSSGMVTDCSSLSEEDLSGLMSEHWRPEGYEDTQSEEAAFQQACDILKYYVRSDHTPKGQVLATEAYLTCNTTLANQAVQLSCRADRVELFADDTLEMLDYKLTRNPELPSAKELAADLPSFIYFLLLWHSYRHDARVRNIRLAQLHLLTLNQVAVVYEQFQIVRHKEALTELVASVMSGGPFEPRVNSGCSWCPVLASCPAWSELDLADLENFAAWRSRREAAEKGQAQEGPQAYAG